MSKKVFYKINQFIQSPEVRVIDETGKSVGVLSRTDAIAKAQEMGVDLVEIAPLAKPPVAKLIDFSKFKYQMQQKKQEERKSAKTSSIKEIWFTPFIAKNDFEVRIKKASEYLKAGDKVKLVVKYQGRQITRKDFGDAIFARATEALEDISRVESAPKLVGKSAFMQLAPSKKKKIESTETEEQDGEDEQTA